jgi:hypothetical protein
LTDRPQEQRGDTGNGTLLAVRRRTTALFEPSASTTVPTWALGGVILMTSIVILIASLTP